VLCLLFLSSGLEAVVGASLGVVFFGRKERKRQHKASLIIVNPRQHAHHRRLGDLWGEGSRRSRWKLYGGVAVNTQHTPSFKAETDEPTAARTAIRSVDDGCGGEECWC
jgi:hypothetical protein